MLRLALLVAVCFVAHGAEDLNDLIYTPLQITGACTRLLDTRGPIGCQSPEDGGVGILYQITDEPSLQAFVDAPEEAYIALITQQMFAKNSTVVLLESLSHYKGALVYDNGFGVGGHQYSPDNIIPNALYGLPFGTGTPNWNSVGGGFNRYSSDFSEGAAFIEFKKPIFFLENKNVPGIIAKYNERNQVVNGKNPSYPLWGVELKSWMHGSKDTETCLRRGYCDPLGSGSPWGTVKPIVDNDDVVMISAKLDTLSFFHDYAYGADADASGIVAAIAAAEVLGSQAGVRDLNRNIMVSLFHGEAFGYIGSSRMAYDITRSPSTFPSDKAPLQMEDISYFLELDQLMSGTDTLRVFGENGNAKAGDIFNALNGATAGLGISVQDQTSTGVPPASLRAFLREIRDQTQRDAFGGVVVASHGDTKFDNDFYHSRFDVGGAYGITDPDTSSAASTRVCEVATLVARAAWKLADPTGPDQTFTANCSFVNELLYCITVDQNCTLVNNFQGPLSHPGFPINRYVGVYQGNFVNFETHFFHKALAYALAVDRDVAIPKGGSCSSDTFAPSYGLIAFQDRCVNSSTWFTAALSPAFEGSSLRPLGSAANNYQDGRDPRYSTWTESRWDSTDSRVFLLQDPAREVATVVGGVVYAVMIAVVFYVGMTYVGPAAAAASE